MNFLKIYSILTKKKELEFKITTKRYEVLLNVFRTHKNMTDGELISHLQYVFDIMYPVDVARDILENYVNPHLALKYYKRGFTYLKPIKKKTQKLKFPTSDKLIVGIGFLFMFLFMFIGAIFLMLGLNDIILYLLSTKIKMALAAFVLTIFIGLFVGEIQLSMYAAEKFKNMEKKEKAKSRK